MTVAFGAIGTGANGSTTVAPSYPAGITAGQLLLCVVTSGATNSETPNTPSGWTLLATGASTDGTFGLDTGPRRATVFGKIADGTESGTLTVSITNGNSCRGTISLFTSSTGKGWLLRASGADDSTSGTGVSMTFGAMDWKVGDVVLVATGQRVDSATASGQGLTATGITFGTRTNRATTAVTTGNDHRHIVDTWAATTGGTGSQAATWAYTASAAVSAGGVLVQIRELGNVAESIAFSETQDATYTAAPLREVNEALVGSAVTQALLVRRIGAEAASAGSYSKQRDDAVAFADAQTEVATFAETRGESIAFTDGQTESSSRNSSAAESIGLATTQTENAALNSARGESLGLADAATETASVNSVCAETLGLADSQTGNAGKNGQRDESLAFSATQTETATLNSAVAESIGLAATQVESATLNSARGESIAFTAAQDGSKNSVFAKQRDESIGLADAASEIATLNSARAEALGLSDGQAEVATFAGTRDEAIGFADVSTGVLTGARTVNEALVGSPVGSALLVRRLGGEASGGAQTYNVSRAESIAFAATQAEASTLNSARGESLGLTDAQSETRSAAAARAESIGFAAAQTHTLASQRSVNTLLVGERRESVLQPYALDAGVFSVTRAESLGFAAAQAEAATLNSARAEAIAFAATQTGSTTSGSAFSKQRDESIGFTDTQSESASRGAQQAESLGLAATQLENATLNSQRDESIGLADSVLGSKNPVFSKQVAETLGFSDAAIEQAAALHSQINEALGLAAAQAEVAAFTRFMAEAIGFSATQIGGTGRATFDWPRLELLASLGGVTADTRLDPDLELLAAVQPNPENLH